MGKWCFHRESNDPSLNAEFLQGEEQLKKNGKGIDKSSLPWPWGDVALYIIKYITYEGRETIMFNYHFSLLNHLRHRQLVNLPYFLLENIMHMFVAVNTNAYPETCVTNHGLIKLIVLDALERQGRS